jgi:nucleotide-binding universal stress UspA family protein
LLPVDFNYADAETSQHHRLSEFACTEFPRMRIECAVEIGDVTGEIVDYAARARADLIAMPSHGAGSFRRMLLGSTTAKVLHDAEIPVWTAPHAPEPSHLPHPKPRKILVAAGPSGSGDRRVIEAATDFADQTQAEFEILPAESASVIRRAAMQRQADLVIGLRAQAYDIVRESPCPVFTV